MTPQTPFIQRFNDDFQLIGDALKAVLPEGACFALFVTSMEGVQAGMLANISKDDVLGLVGKWVEKNFEGDVHELPTGGGAVVSEQRVDRPGEVPADGGGDAVDGGVRGEAPGGVREDPQAGPIGAGVGSLPPDEIAAALLWRAAQVERCVDYIAIMDNLFGTLLAANSLDPTADNRATYTDLMGKVGEYMAQAPGVLDALLKSGVRLKHQPHLDTLAELPTGLAPGSPTQH
jgi:hypothetical protein